uniref:Uncharacterized protein n=1 Tax=Anopheles farauti TaxID=69004 RepID=A0A182QA26_9DIPT
MARRVVLVILLVALVTLDPTAALQKKKKRGVYHGLHGFGLAGGHGAIPLHGVPAFHKGYHPSPYARFPGLHRANSLGGVLPPGYALFPGGASVTSYQRNFPRYPTVYGAGLYPGFGVAPVKPVAGFAPAYAPGLAPFVPTPALPAYPASVPAAVPVPAPAYPQAFVPVGTAVATGNTQQTFFATYPQKPLIPVAVPVQPEAPAKVPVVVQKPFYTAFSTVVPNGGLLPAGVYSPVPNVQPQFVGVPVAGTGSASGVTPTIATTLSTGTTQATQAPQQPWRPVVVNQPSPVTPTPPSNAYLPSYATSQGQIYISSTPAPSLHDHHQQQAHHQALLDLDQGSLHHQDGSGAFNGQPYDVASNHGRYTGPSSYDVDITHNGYQKKKK